MGDGVAGTASGMNRSIEPDGLAATASKSIDESLEQEREAVGDGPDEGSTVPPDDAQSAPPQP